jgi:hypothetical protein
MDKHKLRRQLDPKKHRMDQELNNGEEVKTNRISGCAKNLMKSTVSKDSVDKKVRMIYFY